MWVCPFNKTFQVHSLKRPRTITLSKEPTRNPFPMRVRREENTGEYSLTYDGISHTISQHDRRSVLTEENINVSMECSSRVEFSVLTLTSDRSLNVSYTLHQRLFPQLDVL